LQFLKSCAVLFFGYCSLAILFILLTMDLMSDLLGLTVVETVWDTNLPGSLPWTPHGEYARGVIDMLGGCQADYEGTHRKVVVSADVEGAGVVREEEDDLDLGWTQGGAQRT
jgi:hypothetical protein